jgi:hypothetical protein
MHSCVCVRVCVCACVCVCVYIHTCIHTYIHIVARNIQTRDWFSAIHDDDSMLVSKTFLRMFFCACLFTKTLLLPLSLPFARLFLTSLPIDLSFLPSLLSPSPLPLVLLPFSRAPWRGRLLDPRMLVRSTATWVKSLHMMLCGR